MSAIGKGDWVECVSEAAPVDAWPGVKFPDPILGKVYQVDGIVPGWQYDDGEPALELVGVTYLDPDGFRVSFYPEQFRPIDRRITELFRSWLTDLPADLDVREPEVAGARGPAPRQVHPAFREEL